MDLDTKLTATPETDSTEQVSARLLQSLSQFAALTTKFTFGGAMAKNGLHID